MVTIKHSGIPLIPDHIAERFAGNACGVMLDVYVGYDKRLISGDSRKLTMFQTPYSALRLVTLPMGWTNSVPISHDDVTYILQPEIPDVTIPYIDDVPVKGPDLDLCCHILNGECGYMRQPKERVRIGERDPQSDQQNVGKRELNNAKCRTRNVK